MALRLCAIKGELISDVRCDSVRYYITKLIHNSDYVWFDGVITKCRDFMYVTGQKVDLDDFMIRCYARDLVVVPTVFIDPDDPDIVKLADIMNTIDIEVPKERKLDFTL